MMGLVKRRRRDREQLLSSFADPNALTSLESWDVDLGDRRYSVICARERIGDHDWRWHVSVAGECAVPAWEHLVAIAHSLRPGVVFTVPMPPPSWWVNIAEHCLHVWELQDEHLVEQWRRESRGDAPS